MSIEAGGWVLIIGAVFYGLMQLTSLVLQFMSSQKVDAVKSDLALNTQATALNTKATTDKMDGLTKTTKEIHTLVNSNMAVQLELNAVLSRRMASLTIGTPSHGDDVRAAELAEAALKKHQAQQEIVDKNKSAGGVD